MRFISACVLLWTSCHAVDYAPWFSPPLEIQGKAGGLYRRVDRLQTPSERVHFQDNVASIDLSLSATLLPNWNAEAEVLFTHTDTINFAYEASFLSLRYAWLDDIVGDCVSLVIGGTLFFPNNRFLREFSFPYHGTANLELHATLGKEWVCRDDWFFRTWGMLGYGMANHGSPWIHSLAALEYRPIGYMHVGLFSEALYGTGKHQLIPHLPFDGYASIHHRSVDIGGFFHFELCYFGSLTLVAWYNVYAQNFIAHYWGTTLSLCMPFSLL